jgi:hypothetical protein
MDDVHLLTVGRRGTPSMFSRRDGPTALRPDLVRALAFSLQDAEVDLGRGLTHSRAGMAAVWNGKKGQVVILVRFVEAGETERYVYTEPISSERELLEAIDAALGFTESLGLLMGGTEFHELETTSREAEIQKWNALRSQEGSDSGKRAKAKSGKRKAASPLEDSQSVAVDGPRAVVGRVQVVRKRVGPDSPREGLGRVLSSF